MGRENPSSPASDQFPGSGGVTKRASGKRPEDAIQLITRAMDKIDPDGEWYALGQIGQYITAEHSDFDTRTYGHRKLSDLVKGLKRFETRKTSNQLQLRRVD